MAMGTSQYYGYALPSGYASFGYAYPHNARQLNTNIYPSMLSLPPHYYKDYNRRHLTANQFLRPLYSTLPTAMSKVCAGCHRGAAHSRFILPAKQPAAPAVAMAPSSNKLEEDSAEGFQLLDDLVETVAQSVGTTSDSDPAEVAAVKSIFPDVIDEVIRQIELRFEAGGLGTAEKDLFVNNSEIVIKAISDASSQTDLTAILRPYVAAIKKFTAQGLQSMKAL